jgi:hypothetical protein
MRNGVQHRSTDDLRSFCGDAARQVVGLETRLHTLVAAAERQSEILVLEEAVGTSLQIARALLDAGRHGRYATLLTLRPLLRALAATRE